jgi:hypothetical protein
MSEFAIQPGQRGRSGRFPESNARRTLQRKMRNKTPRSPSAIAHELKVPTRRPNRGPDVPKRNLRAASSQRTPTIVRNNKAIPIHCTTVSFCFPLERLRQSLPSFWTVSGNTTFRCRALMSCCHSSRLRMTTSRSPGRRRTHSPRSQAIWRGVVVSIQL